MLQWRQKGPSHDMIGKTPLKPPPLQRQNASEAAVQQAAFAIQNGQAAKAEQIAGEVLRKNPGDAHAAHIYSYSLNLQGRIEESIAPLERAVQQNHSAVLETQLGIVLRQVGRLDDALKRLKRASNRQPPFPPAFLEYGSLLLQLSRQDEAIEALERGLALAPNFAEILTQLGSAYAAHGERDKATAVFSRALATVPNDPDTLFDLACLMKNSCCFAQAAELFKRVVGINSGDSVARMGLGICLLESGTTDSGLHNLSIASKAARRCSVKPSMHLPLPDEAASGSGRARPSVSQEQDNVAVFRLRKFAWKYFCAVFFATAYSPDSRADRCPVCFSIVCLKSRKCPACSARKRVNAGNPTFTLDGDALRHRRSLR